MPVPSTSLDTQDVNQHIKSHFLPLSIQQTSQLSITRRFPQKSRRDFHVTNKFNTHTSSYGRRSRHIPSQVVQKKHIIGAYTTPSHLVFCITEKLLWARIWSIRARETIPGTQIFFLHPALFRMKGVTGCETEHHLGRAAWVVWKAHWMTIAYVRALRGLDIVSDNFFVKCPQFLVEPLYLDIILSSLRYRTDGSPKERDPRVERKS